VARPQRLSEAQIAELFDPPTEQRDLVRHFTLSGADLGAIRRCRGDHNPRLCSHALLLALRRLARHNSNQTIADSYPCLVFLPVVHSIYLP